MTMLLIVGVALVVFGAFVLVRMPTRPGGTVKTKWFEVSSVGAGLPLIVVGVAAIAVSRVDPFGGDRQETVPVEEVSATARYFEPYDGERGRVSFEDGAMYLQARHASRRLVALARGVAVDRFRVRARYVEGAADHGIGLVCRYEQAGRYYVLAITSDGRYNVLEYMDGRGRSLLGDFRPSGVIDGLANTLEARCEGEEPVTLTLLVNGTRVGAPVQDADTPIVGGAVGLRVGTPSPPVTIRFDDFELLD